MNCNGEKKIKLSDFFKGDFLVRISTYVKHLQKIINEYDIIVLMARKAVCFFEALHRNGEIELNSKCKVTTNRIFTYNIDKFKDEKIVIIDDILVTGKTLKNAIGDLEKYHSNFDVFFLAYDKNFNSTLLQSNQLITNPIKLSESEILLLSNNITNYITASMCTYNIDYPTFSANITSDEFDAIKTKLSSVNLQNSIQEKFDIDISVQSIIEEDNSKLFGIINPQNIIMKIRLFFDKDRTESNLILMPIVLFDEMSYEDLDSLFSLLFPNSKIKKMVKNKNYEYENKFKWIQYFISYKLFYEVVEKTDILLKNEIEYCYARQNWVFPLQYAKAINKSLNINVSALNIQLNIRSNSIFDISDSYAWFQNYLQKHHETDVKHSRNIIFRDIIKQYLGENVGDDETSKIFSNIFDIAIDKGLIVPSTIAQNRTVFRAYHLSEQYKLLDKHYDWFVYMLKEYVSNSDDTVCLDKTIVEKLLVIFFKTVVSLFADEADEDDTSAYSVHYTRFGPVVSSGEAVYEVEGGELTDRLTDNQYFSHKKLNYDFRQRKYYLSKDSFSIEYAWAQAAHRFGDNYHWLNILFDEVKNKNKRIKSFGKYLTLKAIGGKSEDQYLSLLAELRLFQKKYMASKESPLEGLFLSMSGLISGAWKYICYYEKSIQNLTQEMRSHFQVCLENLTDIDYKLINIEKTIKQETDKDKLINLLQDKDKLQKRKGELEVFKTRYTYVFNDVFNAEVDKCNENSKKIYAERMRDIAKLICELLQYWNSLRNLCPDSFEKIKERIEQSQKRNNAFIDFDILDTNKSYIDTLKAYTGCPLIKETDINLIKMRLDEICCEISFLLNEYDKCFKLDLTSKKIEKICIVKHIYNEDLDLPYLEQIKTKGRHIEKALGINSKDFSICVCDLSVNLRWTQELLKCKAATIIIFEFDKYYNQCCLNSHGDLVNDKFLAITQKARDELRGQEGAFIFDDSFENSKVVLMEDIYYKKMDTSMLADYIKMSSDEKNIEAQYPDYSDINIGIVTALPKEYAAVKVLLKNCNECKFASNNTNVAGERIYYGYIDAMDGSGSHRVALCLLPQMGNDFSSIITAKMQRLIPSIKNIIVCGIAGGVPSVVHLGDVVVSDGGIIEYDYGTEKASGFTPKESGAPCSGYLLEAVRYLQGNECITGPSWRSLLDNIQKQTYENYSRPKSRFEKPYVRNSQGEYKQIQRATSKASVVHYGKIGTGNAVQKDPEKRDMLNENYNVIAIEMESSGVNHATRLDNNGYLAIRGISDFCDLSKNDVWQNYAAAVAAAYTVTLIKSLPIKK